jgi:predicted phage terminase large subunit-like protein
MTPLQTIEVNRFELFVMQYLPHHLKNNVPDMHRHWYKGFADKSLLRVCFEAPRASAKSHIGSVFFPLWLVCEGDDDEVQTFSRSGGPTGTSVKWMDKIKYEIENNQLMIEDYGLRKGKHWSQEMITVHRDCDGHKIDIYCRGKKSSARGSRGTIIIDDPQNMDDCNSETVLARDENWLKSDILPIMIKGQRLIFIGTGMSPLSLLSMVKELPSVTSFEFPAEEPIHSGKSVWPAQWSDEYLAMQKADMGIDAYNAEYLCIANVPGNPVFRPEWFKNYDPESIQWRRIKNDGLYIITGFDGAESKSDTADYTAIITIAATIGKKPDYYLLEAFRDKLSCKEGAERLFRTFDTWQQHKSIVESRCKPPNKDAIVEEIEERQKLYGVHINMYQVKPIKDKVTRAHGVQSIIQSGRFHINRNDVTHLSFLKEMTMFTGNQKFHDDRVDGCVHALTEFKKWTGGELSSGSSGQVEIATYGS